jgi:hypothetical protein
MKLIKYGSHPLLPYSVNTCYSFIVDSHDQCLTPSFKLKRPQLLARYMINLKALYAVYHSSIPLLRSHKCGFHCFVLRWFGGWYEMMQKLGEPDRADEKWPGEVTEPARPSSPTTNSTS